MKLIFGVTEMNYEDVTVNGTSSVVLNMAQESMSRQDVLTKQVNKNITSFIH